MLYKVIKFGLGFLLCECAGLNENGSFRFIGSGIIKGVTLLREICHREWAMIFQKLKPAPLVHSLFLLPAYPDVELLCHASHDDSNRLSLWPCKPAKIKWFPYKSSHCHYVYSQQETLTETERLGKPVFFLTHIWLMTLCSYFISGQ